MGIPLLVSAAKTASGLGSETNIQSVLMGAKGIAVVLDVSAAATLAGDTLDVYVQQKIGGNWDDIMHFTQVLGNGGAKNEIGIISFVEAVTANFHNPGDASMGAASVRKGPITGTVRTKYVIAGGANKSFTFSVNMEILK